MHFFASDLSKIFYLGYPVCPKTIFLKIRLVRSLFFMRSVCPKSIFNGSWWYEVDYLQMWTLLRSFSKYWVSSIWIFLKCTIFCIRFVKSWFLGHPVSPKTIFSWSWLSCNPVFMHSVCPKSIYNNSWWFEVDYFTFYNSFLMNLMSSIWIFQQEGMSEVHFHASGLSKIVIQAIRLVPKLYFQVFGWSREHFPDVLFIQILFLMAGYCTK